MTKLIRSFGLTLVAAFALTGLAGCELYFGEGGDDDSVGGGGGGGGFACEDNTDCAAGCYCEDGICEEAGFCSVDADCPAGFECDDRSSCVPINCTCTSDAEAQRQGFGYCDESTSTCQPGTDPAGSCAGAVTCTTAAPNCAQGEVPLVLDGCYTGSCKAIAQCDAAPACEAFQHLADCMGPTDPVCTIVSTGINCTKPDGSQCLPGDAGCVCEDFRFDSCETTSGPN